MKLDDIFLTKATQTLTPEQQAQVRRNIGAKNPPPEKLTVFLTVPGAYLGQEVGLSTYLTKGDATDGMPKYSGGGLAGISCDILPRKEFDNISGWYLGVSGEAYAGPDDPPVPFYMDKVAPYCESPLDAVWEDYGSSNFGVSSFRLDVDEGHGELPQRIQNLMGGVLTALPQYLSDEQKSTMRENVGAGRSIETKSATFTAVVGGSYTAVQNLTINDPTTRSDGSALQDGDSYEVWIKTGKAVVMDGVSYVGSRFPIRRIYDGDSWLVPSPVISGTLTVGTQTWTGSVFSGSQSFSDQVEMTNQDATNATSAMTRQMVDDRVSSLVLDFDHASGPAGATRVLLGGYAVYTYTLPHTRFNTAWIWCQGGGNGGGSGRCGAAGSVRYGGGGGGAGSASEVNLPVSLLPSTTLVVKVGKGGVGGAAQMAPDSNGLDGGAGVESYVLCGGKIIAQVYAQANGGKGGTTTSGAGGGGGIYPYCNIQSNGGGPGGSGNGSSGFVYGAGTCPGGGGGGCDGANAIGRGGYVAMGLSVWGLEASGTQPPAGVDGATGTDAVVDARLPIGCGGSGGNGGYTAQGGAGRRGVRGGGGGGGGAGTNGFGSGAGGDGGHGFVRIILSV